MTIQKLKNHREHYARHCRSLVSKVNRLSGLGDRLFYAWQARFIECIDKYGKIVLDEEIIEEIREVSKTNISLEPVFENKWSSPIYELYEVVYKALASVIWVRQAASNDPIYGKWRSIDSFDIVDVKDKRSGSTCSASVFFDWYFNRICKESKKVSIFTDDGFRLLINGETGIPVREGSEYEIAEQTEAMINWKHPYSFEIAISATEPKK